MTNQEHIRVFDSQGEAYKQAFQIFLDHTDQKRNAKRWLQQVVEICLCGRCSSMPGQATAKSPAPSPPPSTVPSLSNRTPIC